MDMLQASSGAVNTPTGRGYQPSIGSFLNFLFGEGSKTEQFKRFTPEQEDLFQKAIGGGRENIGDAFNYLSNILSQDPEKMAAFERPTRRAFEQQTLPTIAERFSSMGAQQSSAFGQQLGQAGRELEENLATMRAGQGQQALSQLQQLLGFGGTPQFENVYFKRQPGFLENLAHALASRSK